MEAIAEAQWEPKRFPEKTSMTMIVNQHGMSNRAFGQNKVRMMSKPFQTGVKSGSAVLKYNSHGFGRADSTNGQPLDEQKGYAQWNESDVIGSSHPNSVYLVLHKDDTQWYISWVAQADLEDSDIRLAVIKKNGNNGLNSWILHQLWKSDLAKNKEIVIENQFEVTNFSGDLFKVNSGVCTFNQFFTLTYVNSNGEIRGNRSHIVFMPNGEVSNGTIEITKPTVWPKSVPKSDPFADVISENQTPNFDDDYFKLDHEVSEQWSVILGHCVPSNHLPSVYIVPRSFAQQNLFIDVWNPGYGLIFNTTKYDSEESFTGYNRRTDTYNPNDQDSNYIQSWYFELRGDLQEGYTLGVQQERELLQHRHTLPVTEYMKADMKSIWTTFCFKGIVLAHVNWISDSNSWEIKQYHKGNASINSVERLDYKLVIRPSDPQDWWDNIEQTTYYLGDYSYSKAYVVARNLNNVVSSNQLNWQDCGHAFDSPQTGTNSNRLIKY